MAEKDNKNRRKKSTGLALALFILALLVIFILFLVKKNSILTNLKETDFFNRVFGKTPTFVQNHEDSESDNSIDESTESEIVINLVEDTVTEKNTVTPAIPDEKETESAEENSGTTAEEKTSETAAPVKTEEKKTETVKTTKEENVVTTTVKYSDLSLCFVQINTDGTISRKMVKRSVPKNDSPLTTAINLLLEGPDVSKSAEKECMTLIPSGTQLLSARVSDGVAYLNFNDAFEVNPDGVEGYINSLAQIVFTSTSFSTVKSVQFLIDGEKKDYLGSEGQWIGSPLSRGSF